MKLFPQRDGNLALKADASLTLLIFSVCGFNTTFKTTEKQFWVSQVPWDCFLRETANSIIGFLTFDVCSTTLYFLTCVGAQVGESAFKANTLLTFLIFSVSTQFWNYSNAILSKPSAMRLFPQRDGKFYHEILDFWRVFHNIVLLDSY